MDGQQAQAPDQGAMVAEKMVNLPMIGFEADPAARARQDVVPAIEMKPSPPVDPNQTILPEIQPTRTVGDVRAVVGSLFESGTLEQPRYDKPSLILHYEHSDILGPAVQAMACNVTGLGYELIPLFPKEDPDGNELEPPPEAEAERNALELFLATCYMDENGGMGFHLLSHRIDTDVEVTGDGYVEVLRDTTGKIAAFEHLQSGGVLHGMPSIQIPVSLPVRHPVTGELVTVRRFKRFRSYAQVTAGGLRWFKSFGDPRHINWRTGEYSNSPWGNDQDGNDMNGTEVLHFAIYFPEGSYGVPHWVGAAPHIKAGRSAAELMPRWFAKAPIGLKVAMIAGGTWKAASVKKFESMLDGTGTIRGEKESFSVLFLEAETDSGGMDSLNSTKDSPPRVSMQDITWEVPKEIYHGDNSLIATSRESVGRMFRLPPIFYGDSQSYNRDTADTALSVAEDQVFAPIRLLRWETPLNTRLLPAMGVNFWAIRFKSLAAVNQRQSAVISQLVTGGGASPNQLIRLWNEMTGLETPTIKEKWADKPLQLVLKMLDNGIDPNALVSEGIADANAKDAELAKAQLEASMTAMAKQPAAEPAAPPPGGKKPVPGPGTPAAGKKPGPVKVPGKVEIGKPGVKPPGKIAKKADSPPFDYKGMSIVIEVPAGQSRFPGSKPLTAGYGRIDGTTSTDGEELDVFYPATPVETDTAYVIIQVHPTTGAFDEYKAVIAVPSADAARTLYLENMDNAARFGGVLPMPISAMLEWFAVSAAVTPAASGMEETVKSLLNLRNLVAAEVSKENAKDVEEQWYA